MKSVSILTPSLNQARFVGDCISSVAAQDHSPIEQIVVDGGSTDGTLEILDQAKNDSLRVIVDPDSSQSGALNAALRVSTGEIIGWLNTDDAYVGVDTVRRAVEAFERHPSAAVVYGDAAVADESGRILRHVTTDASSLGRVEQYSPLVQPAAFIRRDAIADSFVLEDLDVAMDYELWLRLALAHEFVKVPRVFAIDRDYAAVKSRAQGARLERELAAVAVKHGLPLEDRPAALRAAMRLGRRWRGLRPLLTIERDYRFAFPAAIDARWRRALRQVALSQRRLGMV